MQSPSALRPRDRIAVVAPSSPFGRDLFFRGLGWLRGRYTIDVQTSVLARHGFLAGDDERRRDELARAMESTSVRAIVCARGGYGTTRIVDALPWDAFVKNPKWIVGFSDITALHGAATARGIMSVHGAHVTGLAEADPWTKLTFMRALERPLAPYAWSGLETLVGGTASGVAVGGNLALVASMAAAGKLVVPEGAIVFLEDITERPFRVDRMMTDLIHGGYFARARGLVLGSFTACDPGPDGVTVLAVLAERAATLGIPVLRGAPFGHGKDNEAFVLGRHVEVSRGSVQFT